MSTFFQVLRIELTVYLHLKENFSQKLLDWFVDNELSVHFRVDKTKLISFGIKFNLENTEIQNSMYNRIKIKLYNFIQELSFYAG